jgi:hypothetical protein
MGVVAGIMFCGLPKTEPEPATPAGGMVPEPPVAAPRGIDTTPPLLRPLSADPQAAISSAQAHASRSVVVELLDMFLPP